jgi:SAM-dependent methyltransferase
MIVSLNALYFECKSGRLNLCFEMTAPAERDYVLGTHDEEIVRLGVQHRVWRPVVLDCWRREGITVGSRVVDVGAGPGYATLDLAEIVGQTGRVVGFERSTKFVSAARAAVKMRGCTNIEVQEADLMTDELPEGEFDFSWCRWVTAFVSSPENLVRKISRALRKGGTAIFHEYGAYDTWRFVPPRPSHEKFRGEVIEAWKASGGDPDVGLLVPRLLEASGFGIPEVRPHVFPIRPNDYMWQWPATFVDSSLDRFVDLGRIGQGFADGVKAEFRQATGDPSSLMLTPLVLEITAKKI